MLRTLLVALLLWGLALSTQEFLQLRVQPGPIQGDLRGSKTWLEDRGAAHCDRRNTAFRLDRSGQGPANGNNTCKPGLKSPGHRNTGQHG